MSEESGYTRKEKKLLKALNHAFMTDGVMSEAEKDAYGVIDNMAAKSRNMTKTEMQNAFNAYAEERKDKKLMAYFTEITPGMNELGENEAKKEELEKKIKELGRPTFEEMNALNKEYQQLVDSLDVQQAREYVMACTRKNTEAEKEWNIVASQVQNAIQHSKLKRGAAK